MSKSPHNAGQTIEIEHLIHGPVSTVDFGKIAVTENWGRLFIKQGDSNEVVIERGAYVALRDAIDHFIGPQPDPRDLETCGKCMGSGYGGHPDSGHLCDDCDGIGGVLQPALRDDAIVRLVDAAQVCVDTFTSTEHSNLRAALAAAKAVQR